MVASSEDVTKGELGKRRYFARRKDPRERQNRRLAKLQCDGLTKLDGPILITASNPGRDETTRLGKGGRVGSERRSLAGWHLSGGRKGEGEHGATQSLTGLWGEQGFSLLFSRRRNTRMRKTVKAGMRGAG